MNSNIPTYLLQRVFYVKSDILIYYRAKLLADIKQIIKVLEKAWKYTQNSTLIIFFCEDWKQVI